MIRCGIDEAGLGPVLGPYCAAAAALGYEKKDGDPRTLCPGILSAEPGEGLLAVGDSKAIYAPGKMAPLEKTVLAFFAWFTEKKAEDALGFIRTLDPDSTLPGDIPWYKELKDLKLPLCLDHSPEAETAVLTRECSRAGIRPENLRLTVQSARAFNGLLTKTGNKASACQRILSPLIREAGEKCSEIIVDRQGGRRYYGDWLIELFPGSPLRALRESKENSSYEDGDLRIEFQIKADALCFETALASMFAKYAREICMTAFNNYWAKQIPGIKKTAGYYTDGHRFIKELKERKLFPADPDLILRKK